MTITYDQAKMEDAGQIYSLCRQLICDYENFQSVDLEKVLCWVRKKIETCIHEYTVIFADGRKAGYYHFYQNENGEYELDDLYVFPELQNRGIGSRVIQKCCSSVNASVMLYVFIQNQRAVSLYRRMGFEIAETVGGSRFIMKRNSEL